MDPHPKNSREQDLNTIHIIQYTIKNRKLKKWLTEYLERYKIASLFALRLYWLDKISFVRRSHGMRRASLWQYDHGRL